VYAPTVASTRQESVGGVLRPPKISKEDDEFETKLGVQFVEGREGILMTELNELFEKVNRLTLKNAGLSTSCVSPFRSAGWAGQPVRMWPHAPRSCAALAQVGFPRRDPDKLKLALENT
jgi:hypothetical protein